MSIESPNDVTILLNRMSQGDGEASRGLLDWLYQELRQLARSQAKREANPPTQQATAIVHEAYLRLFGKPNGLDWASRRHFFAAAAKIMRHIRIDDVRRKKRIKRGGDRKVHALDIEPAVFDQAPDQVLAVHEALEKLQGEDPRKVEMINLRYFAGLTEEETAEVLGLSRRTIQLEWRIARAWLHRELSKGDTDC